MATAVSMRSAYREHFKNPRSLPGGFKKTRGLTVQTLNDEALTGKSVNAEVFGLKIPTSIKAQQDKAKSKHQAKYNQEHDQIPNHGCAIEKGALSQIFSKTVCTNERGLLSHFFP